MYVAKFPDIINYCLSAYGGEITMLCCLTKVQFRSALTFDNFFPKLLEKKLFSP